MRAAWLLMSLLLDGCAAMSPGPSIAKMQDDRRCHVWLDNGSGHASARVEGQRAILYGGFGESSGASFSGSDIVMGDTPVGTYAAHVLTLKGASAPATVGPRATTIATAGGSVDVQYNRACSDRDAALGIASLWTAIASSHY